VWPYGVAIVVLVARSGVVEVDLIATHLSFFPSSTTATSEDFSLSSSEVTLSSVSASTPVVVSDSEELADDDEAISEVLAGISFTTVDAAGMDSVADEESLFAAAASFFASLARSFLSNF
jgi:hypothetical protein